MSGVPPLPAKLLLAFASVAVYVFLASLAEAVEPLESVPDAGRWFHYLAGAAFGALVLTPYARGERRMLRGIALSAAGAATYRLAVWFVTAGPLDYDLLVTFIAAGAGAALLCALAVAALAPQRASLRTFGFAGLAGALGGAAFDLKIPADSFLLAGHGSWQLLVCLALHAGFAARART